MVPGTGRIPRCLLNNFRTYINRINYIGIDFAENMIKICRKKFKKTSVKIQKKFRFLNFDFSSEDLIENLLPLMKRGGKTIILLMFGTFGNLTLKYRKKTLNNIKTLLSGGGECYLSIFNKKYLAKEGLQTYSSIKPWFTVGNEDIEFNLKVGEVSTSSGFYSHWFSYSEIQSLLNKFGFKIIDRYEPIPRGWILRIRKSKTYG